MRSDGYNPITSLRLHTKCQGLSMILGPLELSIMQTVWEQSKPLLSNKEIVELLVAGGKPRLSLATIGTTMHRLAEKGYVYETSLGGAYLYQAVMSEDELECFVVQHIIGKLRECWPQWVTDTEVLYATD